MPGYLPFTPMYMNRTIMLLTTRRGLSLSNGDPHLVACYAFRRASTSPKLSMDMFLPRFFSPSFERPNLGTSTMYDPADHQVDTQVLCILRTGWCTFAWSTHSVFCFRPKGVDSLHRRNCGYKLTATHYTTLPHYDTSTLGSASNVLGIHQRKLAHPPPPSL